MNFKRKLLIILISFIFIIPTRTLAYSKYLIPGGESIGITINTPGVIVVGFYKVNGVFIAKDQGLKIGDRIISVNDNTINNIEELSKEINSKENSISLKIGLIRNLEKKFVNLKLKKEETGIYKTGIYVKDSITGIGTLTFITVDGKFASLGHAVIENNSDTILDVLKGQIYNSKITSITKSNYQNTGEKNAKIFFDEPLGIINNNFETGVFGIYEGKINNQDLLEVGSIDEVKIGKAEIITVLNDNNKQKYDIEILSIDKNNKTKNFKIRLVDQKLINTTGGIVKGMSGSPIIQNGKIIGAITHAIVNNPLYGYGISIEKMLESIE